MSKLPPSRVLNAPEWSSVTLAVMSPPSIMSPYETTAFVTEVIFIVPPIKVTSFPTIQKYLSPVVSAVKFPLMVTSPAAFVVAIALSLTVMFNGAVLFNDLTSIPAPLGLLMVSILPPLMVSV